MISTNERTWLDTQWSQVVRCLTSGKTGKISLGYLSVKEMRGRAIEQLFLLVQRCTLVFHCYLFADIQIVEKREAPLLGSKVTESEDLAIWHKKEISGYEVLKWLFTLFSNRRMKKIVSRLFPRKVSTNVKDSSPHFQICKARGPLFCTLRVKANGKVVAAALQ